MTIKFVWNGIKTDKKLHRAWYSNGELKGYPVGTITIYARDYSGLPKVDGLNVENDTDIRSDYIVTDRVRVTPDNPFYAQVLVGFNAAKARGDKLSAKSNASFFRNLDSQSAAI